MRPIARKASLIAGSLGSGLILLGNTVGLASGPVARYGEAVEYREAVDIAYPDFTITPTGEVRFRLDAPGNPCIVYQRFRISSKSGDLEISAMGANDSPETSFMVGGKTYFLSLDRSVRQASKASEGTSPEGKSILAVHDTPKP